MGHAGPAAQAVAGLFLLQDGASLAIDEHKIEAGYFFRSRSMRSKNDTPAHKGQVITAELDDQQACRGTRSLSPELGRRQGFFRLPRRDIRRLLNPRHKPSMRIGVFTGSGRRGGWVSSTVFLLPNASAAAQGRASRHRLKRSVHSAAGPQITAAKKTATRSKEERSGGATRPACETYHGSSSGGGARF